MVRQQPPNQRKDVESQGATQEVSDIIQPRPPPPHAGRSVNFADAGALASPATAATSTNDTPYETAPGSAELYDTLLPPSFYRQQSTQVGGGASKLPFLPVHVKSIPTAPRRTQDEGVTSATVQQQSQNRRKSSLASQRSASSLELDPPNQPPSRSASRRSLLQRRPSGSSDQVGNRNRQHRRSLQDAARDSQPILGAEGDAQLDGEAMQASKAKRLVGKLNPTRLVDLHAIRPDLSAMAILPTAVFPGQGSGKDSEFLQDEPIWAKQPWKSVYLAYFGLSVGLVFLPYFAIASINPKWRARPSWTWKRSTLVRLYRHGTRLTFRTHTSLSRDLSEAVPHSSTLHCKFVWIPPTPEHDIRGELRRAMKQQQISSVRTCGFWYGEPLDEVALAQVNHAGGGSANTTGVGRRAGLDEKVVYHLHGGAYWIGTAHEKDVTSAVNTEVLRYLDELYKSGASKAKVSNRCTRSLSLDYRLCVPHRPRLGSYPAALLDAIAGYLYLVRFCGFRAKNIIVAGDSAGGNLALALCRYLRDERIEEVPGSLLLLSPWADISRSHAGPLSSPNLASSVHRNRDVDIISPSTAFRNTAVQAFLGGLEAREAYRNPYLSSCSLQLLPEDGGDGPDWGFEGFPRRTYLVTGSGEISNDQHLTLAHRMASGTRKRMPIYTGDQLSRGEDPYEMAARLTYPRPSDHTISLWPSASGTPAEDTSAPAVAHPSQGNDIGEALSAYVTEATSGDARNAISPLGKTHATVSPAQDEPTGGGPPPEAQSGLPAGVGPKETAVKTTDWAGSVSPCADRDTGLDSSPPSHVKHEESSKATVSTVPRSPRQGCKNRLRVPSNRRLAEAQQSLGPRPPLIPMSSGAAFMRAQSRSLANTPAGDALAGQLRFLGDDGFQGRGEDAETAHPLASEAETGERSANGHSAGYFDVGGEDRLVWLDEVRDGVHDLLLFPWHEPERGKCWRRIAEWIDGDGEGAP
ncbi:unnamed protein product [Parajaminaea phylloscopi]